MDLPGGPSTTAPAVESLYRRVGLEPPRYRRADVEQRSSVDRDRAVRWWRAMGFPEVDEDVVGFGESDVAMARRLGELIDEAGVLRLARLMGASFSRIAEAQLNSVEPEVVAAFLGGGEVTEAVSSARLAALEQAMLYVWRRHLLAALGHRMEAPPDVEQAVGFADITAFTKLTKRLSAAELAEVVDHFESQAFDVVSSYGGRVVKLIGDEVMFVCGDLADAARIGLDLIDEVASGERPVKLHCGIAFGATVDVGGDVFGSTVNLASRLTTLAKPGTVVVPRDVAKRLADVPDLSVHAARQVHDLKGVGNTRIAAVRRATPTP
jgi:adenylate cyclase